MNEQQRAAVQQALDAFAVLKMNDYSVYECTKHETDKIDDAETALRQLLEPEPVHRLTPDPAATLHPELYEAVWNAQHGTDERAQKADKS